MGLHKGDFVRGIRGRYRIESLIGRGGLGCVWKARADDDTAVAVKEPLTGTAQDQLNLEKLQIEAEVLQNLTGPNPVYTIDHDVREHIVRYVDVEGSPPRKLVLQFVEGTSMDQKYRPTQPTHDQVVLYAEILLRVVKALHENNILHRDISPHNLISTLDPQSDPVLVDFGTAKVGFRQLSASVLAESVIQKAGYSAPELALGLASPSSDLYSVGATLLFLYTGQNPQYLLANYELNESHKAVQRIPIEHRQIIRKSLSYHPGNRYQTAEDMWAALAGKKIPVVYQPHIVASGRKYVLSGQMIVGRQHRICTDDCRRKGYTRPPDIGVYDPERYVGRHHAKIQLAPNGVCWIEDLNSVSHTAIRKATKHGFEVLNPGRGYKLDDGDIIALAYSPTKGPYMTISYHAK